MIRKIDRSLSLIGEVLIITVTIFLAIFLFVFLVLHGILGVETTRAAKEYAKAIEERNLKAKNRK